MNEYARIPPRGFEGGQPMIQDAALRPNLGMQLPQFGMGSMSGIQSALQPLRGFISNQIQQQTNEKINPFIEEVATNAQETFDIQSGPQLGFINTQPMPYNNYNMSLRGGLESLFQPVGGQQNMNRAVPMAQGGSVPRQTMIEEQPHMLAYINPEEEMMLRRMGGTGQPGPGGVPAYPPQRVNEVDQMDRRQAVRDALDVATNNDNDNDEAVQREIQAQKQAREYNLMRTEMARDAAKKTLAFNAFNKDGNPTGASTTLSSYRDGKKDIFAPVFDDPKSAYKEARRQAKYMSSLSDRNIMANQRMGFYDDPKNWEANPRDKQGFLKNAITGHTLFQVFNGLFNRDKILAANMAQQGNYNPGGIVGLMDKFTFLGGQRSVKYKPVFDQYNRVVGTVGYGPDGEAIKLNGRGKGFDEDGNEVDFSAINETKNSGEDPISGNPRINCPEGFVYDVSVGACVPITTADTIEETVEETTEADPIVVDPNVSVETEYPLFNQGGVASLNDVARNMSRGPRGIAGYQTYMR